MPCAAASVRASPEREWSSPPPPSPSVSQAPRALGGAPPFPASLPTRRRGALRFCPAAAATGGGRPAFPLPSAPPPPEVRPAGPGRVAAARMQPQHRLHAAVRRWARAPPPDVTAAAARPRPRLHGDQHASRRPPPNCSPATASACASRCCGRRCCARREPGSPRRLLTCRPPDCLL